MRNQCFLELGITNGNSAPPVWPSNARQPRRPQRFAAGPARDARATQSTTMASLAVSADASGGLPRMTKELLLASCLENDGYETPELNDNLYLHFKGFQRIENLEPYTGLKGLWLEANGLCRVEGLGHLGELRCLFLGRNLLRTVHGLSCAGLPY